MIPGNSPTTFAVRLTNKSTVPVAVCPCMGPPTRYLVLDPYHEDDPRRLSPPEILYSSAPLKRFYTCISPDESIELNVDLHQWEPVWAGHRESFPPVDLLIGPGSYRIRARYLDNGRVRRRACQGFSGEVRTEWVEIEVPSTEASAFTTPHLLGDPVFEAAPVGADESELEEVGQQLPAAPRLPIPPETGDSELLEFADGHLQLSFIAEREYPDSGIRDFYAQWAGEHRWKAMPWDGDAWDSREWQSFEDMSGVTIDQLLAHWQSPDGSESLRLALLHTGDRTRQEVYVIRSPFDVLAAAEETAVEDLPDPECPDGQLKEPVAHYRPVPSGRLLQADCPDPLLSPDLRVGIDSAGRVAAVEYVRSSGCPTADEALRRCVSRWGFEPATCDGEPVGITRGVWMVWNEDVPVQAGADPCPPFEEASPPAR